MVALSRRPARVSFSVVRPVANNPRVKYGHRTSGPSIQSPVLLGSVETRAPLPEATYSRTALLQPLLRFSFPGTKPGTITLRDVDTPANTFGPFAVNGSDEAQVNVDLTAGKTYEIVEQAQNSDGVNVAIVGTIEVIAMPAYSTFGGVTYATSSGVAYATGV